MTQTEFNPTDEFDPEDIQAMGKKPKAKKKPAEAEEEDSSLSFQVSGGVFDTQSRETMPKRRRRPKMGK